MVKFRLHKWEIEDLLRIIAILFACLLYYGCLPPGPELQGEVKIKKDNDTLTVDYDLIYFDAGLQIQIDSLFFRLPSSDTGGLSDSLIFTRDDPMTTEAMPGGEAWIDDRPRIAGQLRYVNVDDDVQKYSFRINETRITQQRLDTVITRPFYIHPPASWGVTLSVGMASFDRSVLPSEVRTIEGSIEAEAEGGLVGLWRAWRGHLYFGLIGSAPHSDNEDQDDSRSFTYLGLDIRRKFNIPLNLYWSPFIGGQSSLFEVVDYPQEYRLDNSGVSAGFQIGGKFDEFSYSYNSHLDGYHQFEYRAYLIASPSGRMGTIYSVSHGDMIRMYRMRFYIEGIFGDCRPMIYHYDCNIIHDILAGGFLTPIALLGAALDAL